MKSLPILPYEIQWPDRFNHWRHSLLPVIRLRHNPRWACFFVLMEKEYIRSWQIEFINAFVFWGWGYNFIKKSGSGTDVFLWILQSFKNTFSTERLRATASTVCIRNFLKENNLMTVKNRFIIADPSNITKYKQKFKKL